MSRIKIKNFGPIKDGLLENGGWIDVRKITLFIGNQGSGKSTVAKLISVFTKIEKSLVRGDFEKSWFETNNRLKSYYLPYHRLEDYLNDNSVIEYKGNRFSIIYKNDKLSISEVINSKYSLPKIMYIPAERNLLTYIKGAEELKLSSEALQEFSTEYYSAMQEMGGRAMLLPINKTEIRYDKRSDELYLRSNDFRIKLRVASSGFQSFVPLYLVSDYLANSVKRQSGKEKAMSSEETMKFQKGLRAIWDNEYLTDIQKRQAISELASVYNKTAFINIVEEPEQNLFPSSQWKMLQYLLGINNMTADNKLIITTHSPYLMNYLTIAIKAKQVFDDLLGDKRDSLSSKIESLISLNSCVNADDVSIYEMDEETGKVKLLPKYNNLIPSDDNSLNNKLAETNNLFEKLQEIEEENEN
ncbi:MAG: ATP-binding protein [Dysgonamonadaceae bacterium]|jgi:predicted ATPase|nr:ATP-binding protein [Dysgonamonadaceae bacterium]